MTKNDLYTIQRMSNWIRASRYRYSDQTLHHEFMRSILSDKVRSKNDLLIDNVKNVHYCLLQILIDLERGALSEEIGRYDERWI